MAKKSVKKAAPAASKKNKRPAKAASRAVVSAKTSKARPKPVAARTNKPTRAKGKVHAPVEKVKPAKTIAPKADKHPAPESKPARKDGAVLINSKPEAAKSTRPMLLQGPIAIRPMGKKATLVLSPPKPKEKPVKKRIIPTGEPAFVVVQPPTKAVATSEKAAKNKAGFNQKDLDYFRELLLAKRRELLGDMNSMEREALRENSTDLSNLPVHMADQGTDAYEQEFTLHLVEKDRSLLRELNDALAKIQNGTYGICEGTGLPISKPRLEAQPWARHSIEHARALEKRAGMFRR